MNPLESLIIRRRNGVNYLAEAVGSAYVQNVKHEFIIVDVGSTDATAELAQSPGCKVISVVRSRLSAARNIGLIHALGEYILFLEHGDFLRPGAIEQLLNAFREKNIGIALVKAQDFVSSELAEAEKHKIVIRAEPYYGVMSDTMLFCNLALEHVKGFDESKLTAQTLDLIHNAQRAGIDLQKIENITVDRRLHLANMGRAMEKQENKDHASLLREKIRYKLNEKQIEGNSFPLL